jgi:hypothetical protein
VKEVCLYGLYVNLYIGNKWTDYRIIWFIHVPGIVFVLTHLPEARDK